MTSFCYSSPRAFSAGALLLALSDCFECRVWLLLSLCWLFCCCSSLLLNCTSFYYLLLYSIYYYLVYYCKIWIYFRICCLLSVVDYCYCWLFYNCDGLSESERRFWSRPTDAILGAALLVKFFFWMVSTRSSRVYCAFIWAWYFWMAFWLRKELASLLSNFCLFNALVSFSAF